MKKYARIIIAAASALALSLCLFGCGGSGTSGSGAVSSETKQVEKDAAEDIYNPNKVEIKTCKIGKDYEGKKRPYVVVEWTNNTGETTSFDLEYSDYAFQDGEEVERTFGDEDEWFDDQNKVRPGKTQTIKMMFEANTKDNIEVEIREWLESSNLVAYQEFEM